MSGVYLECPFCGGVGRKIREISPYWDKLMSLVQSSPTTTRNDRE